MEVINHNEHRISLKYNFKFSTNTVSKQQWMGLHLYVHVQLMWKTKANFVERQILVTCHSDNLLTVKGFITVENRSWEQIIDGWSILEDMGVFHLL